MPDIESPDIGYYNEGGQASRLERQPYRQFSQGLNDKNCCVFNIEGHRVTGESILCRGVEEMIIGIYPEFQDAWELLDEWPSIAISRDVALSRKRKGFPTTVYYKGETVGFINPGSMKVIVPSSERGWIISRYLGAFGWEIE